MHREQRIKSGFCPETSKPARTVQGEKHLTTSGKGAYNHQAASHSVPLALYFNRNLGVEKIWVSEMQVCVFGTPKVDLKSRLLFSLCSDRHSFLASMNSTEFSGRISSPSW